MACNDRGYGFPRWHSWVVLVVVVVVVVVVIAVPGGMAVASINLVHMISLALIASQPKNWALYVADTDTIRARHMPQVTPAGVFRFFLTFWFKQLRASSDISCYCCSINTINLHDKQKHPPTKWRLSDG